MLKLRSLTVIALFFTMLFSSAADGQRSRASVSGSEVTGTFRMNFRGKYRKMANDMYIQALGGGKLRIAFDLIYPYTLRNGEISVNMGQLEGEARIKGDTAVYESDEYGPCRITIKFVRPGVVKVTQESLPHECGFGHNVTSDGTYLKVSSKRPKFDLPN